jgi:hypothetical protein
MKLNEVSPYLETSGELEEQFFGVQDQGMLFDILRKKMYSNPILAICREISCNARDAHREVGTPEVPIHIHLPTTLEPYYKIKDFGPGISPDRMSNVFIKYTASTKRSDNLQTGGFGLGAKTPFSYSDTFSIITVVDGIKYNYNCFIDETKVGKLMLASESPTTEKNGTEIIIPVLDKNWNEFKSWTESACRFWDVKPIIKGDEIRWEKIEPLLEGNQWAIVKSKDYNRTVKLIIDGIEYPLDLNALRKYADGSLVDSSRGNLIMYFSVGELSLSASREQVYLDERTQKCICARLEEMQNEIRQKVTDKIEAQDNLWLANIYYQKELKTAFNDLNFLGTLTWRGIPLVDRYPHTGCPTFGFVKGKYSRKYGTDPNKISRSNVGHFSFDSDAELYINDLPIKEPTPRHVKKAFDDNPKLKSVFVICPSDKVSIDDLNTKIHLDKMAPKFLSAITKANARAYTPAASRLILFKFDENANSFRQVSYASLDDDPKQKVLCKLTKESYPHNNRQVSLSNRQTLHWSSLKSIMAKFPNYSFYGVDNATPNDRIAEDFSDLEDIEKFIQNSVLTNNQIDYVGIKFAQKHHHYLEDRLTRSFPQLKSLISDATSTFIRAIELQLKLKKLSRDETGLLDIYESVNGTITDAALSDYLKANPDNDAEKLDKEFAQKYPLLEHINTYNYNQIINHLADYINLIDKNGENNV